MVAAILELDGTRAHVGSDRLRLRRLANHAICEAGATTER